MTVTSSLNSSVAVAGVSSGNSLRQISFRLIFGGRSLRNELFGPEREEVRGDWRKLHNEELCNLY